MTEVLYDHGDETAFKVLQLGGGECAGAAQETVASNFAEAANERNYRNAFLLQRKYEEALECSQEIGRRVGQSLQFLAGQPAADKLEDIATSLQNTDGENSALGLQLAEFAAALAQLNANFDDAAFITLAGKIDEWTAQAAKACQDIDRQLDLSASLPAASTPTAKKKALSA
jgi:hypothetical protein